MNYLDWLVLFGTIIFIAGYGALKTTGHKNIEGYLKGDNSLKWWMIGISIMATQASAITFLSTPGQAIEDGMRFIQFYFGLPIAMVIISVTMVPIYYRLKVYTAYEYLETRFDPKTRSLAAILFLMLRGVSAGITLFAPSLILSTILRWPLTLTTIYNRHIGDRLCRVWWIQSCESHAALSNGYHYGRHDTGGNSCFQLAARGSIVWRQRKYCG